MNIDSIVNSVYNSITYILSDSRQKGVWMVDCGDIDRLNVPEVIGVLLTHIHFDHIYGLNLLLERFPGLTIYTNHFGKEGLLNPKINLSKYSPDIKPFILSKPEAVQTLSHESVLSVFDCEIQILSVPGHDPSCLAYLIDGRLFTGDALIPGETVITGFPHSNRDEAKASERRLQELGKEYHILPGHAVNAYWR